MANRYCIHCGTQIREGARFCTSCGKPIEKRAGAAQNPNESTRALDTMIPAITPDTTAVMSPIQGPFQPTAYSAPQPDEPANTSSRTSGFSGLSSAVKNGIIGVAAGIIVILILLVVFVFHP